MNNSVSRRRFLESTSLAAMATSIPSFLAQTASACEANTGERILVVIQLDGGNDGLNTVIPFRDPDYARFRKALRIDPSEQIRISDEVALHPAMRSAADLLEDGQLSIVQNVGYPNPDRSHDVSMRIWHTGTTLSPNDASTGWLGNTTDAMSSPQDGSPSSIMLGTESPAFALRPRKSTSINMARLNDLERLDNEAGVSAVGKKDDPNDLRAYLNRTKLDAFSTADRLKQISATTSATYPDFQFAQRLKMIAQMIKAGFKTPIYYCVHGGFDTHYLQLPDHQRLLFQFSAAVKAFIIDLRASKCDDRVLVMGFSEFGRRVEENASQGTDHGTAGPVFLAGACVRAGLIGDTPRLDDLEDGDIKMKIDFRQVYATVLERWLNISPAVAMASSFSPLDLFSQ